MRSFIFTIDKISTWIGHAFAWCIVIMTIGVGYEVFVRYVLRDPTSWAFDLSYMMYGALFMMSGAYTLSRDGMVRADMYYRRWRPTTQATIELTLYILFFFPAMTAFVLAGWKYAEQSLRFKEVSVMSPANVPIFQFKLLIPIVGALMIVQGLAQVARCIVCLRTGQWPEHIADVEETESIILHQHQDQQAHSHDGAEGGNKP